MQADLDRWLVEYNSERAHLGYCTLDKRPINIVNAYSAVTQVTS